ARLRGQDARRPDHVASRDRPHPGARGQGRQGRGPPQGGRSLRLRPCRRGDGRSPGRRRRRGGGARRDGCTRRAARIGLPLTLRERVRQFSVVTGTTAGGEPDLDWNALAAPGSAFAVYMGVANAPLLRRNLLAAGADPDTPVVIVENGTL